MDSTSAGREAFESEQTASVRRQLVEGLIELQHTQPVYRYRRLLPADHSDIYAANSGTSESDVTSQGPQQCSAALPDYINYDVLSCAEFVADNASASAADTCQYCDTSLSALPLDRVLHWSRCLCSHHSAPSSSSSRRASGDGGGYYCDHCACWLQLTSAVQILLHKRLHEPSRPAGAPVH